MNEELEEHDTQAAVSEQPDVNSGEEQEPKMVPLAALEAERRKRQEESSKRQEAEERSRLYQEALVKRRDEPEPEPEDPSGLVEKRDLRHSIDASKRAIMEEIFKDMNPEAVLKVDQYLDPILKKKPWLADSVRNATNRYARAYEIVNDYLHLVEDKPLTKSSAASDAARMVQNSQKPRSPAEMGKSANPRGTEFLKSIQGKKEFRDYRAKMLRGDS